MKRVSGYTPLLLVWNFVGIGSVLFLDVLGLVFVYACVCQCDKNEVLRYSPGVNSCVFSVVLLPVCDSKQKPQKPQKSCLTFLLPISNQRVPKYSCSKSDRF